MTKLEICNRALAVLGHDRAITDFDGMTGGVYNDNSTEAVRCRQFYASALNECLSEHDWDFAAVERNIGTIHPDEYGWVRVQTPPDAIRVTGVTDAEGKPFKTKRNRDFLSVQTFGQSAKMRYISTDIVEEELPFKFVEALIYKLASLICGPMYGDDRKAEGYSNMSRQKLSMALTVETDETAYRGQRENPFQAARG